MEAEGCDRGKGDILWESNTTKNLFSPDPPLADIMGSNTEASSDGPRNSGGVFLSVLAERCITESTTCH